VTDAQSQKPAKAAVLVIHGMGQQSPYETLDHFAQGLARHFATTGAAAPQWPTIRPLLINHGDWSETAIRLTLRGEPPPRGHSTIDLYEYYWAPYTEGKISYLQTLKWLRQTALTPLRYLASSYELFPPGRAKAAFLREIFRILFLSLPLVTLTIVLGYLLTKADRILPTASGLVDIWRQIDLAQQAGLVALAALIALNLVMVRALLRLARERHPIQGQGLHSLSDDAARRWRYCAICTLALSLVAATAFGWMLWPVLMKFADRIWRLHLLAALIAGGVNECVRRILVGYVGDIAVYANADAKAVSFQARSKILEGAREAILRLLRSPEAYERVVLAGHSLGSVIAYDLINRLLDEVRADRSTGAHGALTTGVLTTEELSKLRGLVTFGSPLDKICYFFRTQVPPGQPIRAQILSFMHGFRRAPSGRGYGTFQFQRYPMPDPSDDFTWINIWAAADPVSGHLDFYRVAGANSLRSPQNQYERPYPMTQWGYAHVKYWSDPVLYDLISEHLL
jgi:hypothetical protein